VVRIHPRTERKRPKRLGPFLTKTYHGSRLVFTGDLAGSRPRLRSGHQGAIQIAVLQLVEKIRHPSVANRRGGYFHIAFSQKHWSFAPFLSVRFWKIPKQILRFYYGRQRPKKTSPNSLIEKGWLAPFLGDFASSLTHLGSEYPPNLMLA